MKKAEKGKPQDSYELFAPQRWRIWIRILACILSVLLTAYAVPANVYAELIELADTAVENSQSEAVGENQAEADEPNQDTVFEVVDRREESVKHFRMSDGTYAAVQYGVPVHTLGEDGAWQDIDNTLAESGSEYSTPDAKIKFAKKITGSEDLFALHDGNRKITMRLVGAEKKVVGQVTNTHTEFPEDATQLQKMMTLDKLSSQILYSDILDGVDLEYVVNSCNIKENIIVKERGEAYSYTFEIKLNNLEAVLCEDGSVALFDPDTDELVYAIPKGYMVDADGEHSDAVTYSLSNGGNGKYTLTVSADAEWINQEGRAFPVTIDPPINTTPNTTNMVDTYIDSDNPNSLYYNFSFLASGTGSGGQEFISFWKLAPLPSLPANSYIASAKFSLYCQSFRPHTTQTSGQTLKLGVYQVTSDWTTSITWNKHQSNGVGAFSEAELIDYATLTSASQGNYVTWDITKLYRMWHGGTESNFGIVLAQLDEANTDALLSSSENTNNNIPRLIIDYRDMKGVESYWSGSSHSAGMAGNGFVNHATGNLVFSIPTVSTGDALFGFTPTLVYNSAVADKYNTNSDNPNVHYKYISTGLGLKLNTNESIVERTYVDEENQTKTFYIWADGDGTEHYFLYDTASQEWKDEDGLGLTLTVGTSEYEIKDKNHNTRRFTNSSDTDYIYAGGILKHIEDQYGNKLRFNYNSKGQTTTVDIVPSGHSTSNAIQYLTFSYNSIGALYSIENVVTGQVVTLKYCTSFSDTSSPSTANAGPLAQVIYGYKSGSTVVDYATMSYTYSNTATDGVYRLKAAKDNESETEICYTYDSAGRVRYVYERYQSRLGQRILFTYGTGYTEVRTSGTDDNLQAGVTTSDDIITRYSLDYQGRSVGAYSTDAARTTIYGATNQAYDSENQNAKNSLKQAAVINQVSTNHIYNGSFENSSVLDGWNSNGNVAVTNCWNSVMDTQVAHLSATSSENAQIYQYVTLPSGTYTLSAKCVTSSNTDFNFTMSVKATDHSCSMDIPQNRLDNEQCSSNPSLTFEVDGGTDGYKTYRISFQASKVATAASGMASLYVNDIMLSSNIGVSQYNLVQNGSFGSRAGNALNSTNNYFSNAWEPNSTISDNGDDAWATIEDSESTLGQYLSMEGNLDDYRTYDQTIIIPQPAALSPVFNGRSFILSGFAKAPLNVANEDSFFGFDVNVNYNDGSSQLFLFDFNKDTQDWQFLSGAFTTKDGKEIASISISCVYANQVGTAYFDEISLIEVVGDEMARYSYDNKGRVKSTFTGNYGVYYDYADEHDDGYIDYLADLNQPLTAIDTKNNLIEYTYNSNGVLMKESVYKYETDDNSVYRYNLAALCDYYHISTPNEIAVRRYSNISREEKISETTYSINAYGLNTSTRTTDFTDSQTPKYLHSSTSYETTTGSVIFGKTRSHTDTSGITTTYLYDNRGFMTTEYVSGQGGLYYYYDALGRILKIVPYVYQPSLFATYTIEESAENAAYVYDSAHRLESITTATTTYTFEYDDFGNTSRIKAGDHVLVEYGYAANNGKLTSMTYGNGKVMSYLYDDLDRVKEICYTDSSGNNQYYRYTYTATGLTHSVECSEIGRKYLYSYDSNGRLVSYGDSDTATDTFLLQVDYTYDKMERLFYRDYSFSYAIGEESSKTTIYTDYYYNNTDDTLEEYGLILADDSMEQVIVSRAYDTLKRLSTRTTDTTQGFFLEETYAYRDINSFGQTTGQLQSYATQIGEDVSTYSVTYNQMGYISAIVESEGTQSLRTQYTYDNLGQLIREDNPYLNKTYVYTYDNAGNRTSKKTYAYTTGTLGTATATQTLTYSTGAWGDQLTGTTYDAVGNPTTYNGFTMTWSGRQLKSMVKNGGQYSYSFTYNDEGIRTSKTVQGVKHTYMLEGSRIVGEQFGVHLLLYLYDENGAPIGLQHRTSSYAAGVFDTYYFEKNVFGDVIGVYTADGTKIGTYKYDAWGNCTRTAASGTTALQKQIFNTYNPFRYRGYYYDVETALYYLQSRYYDPATGRFINVDSALYNNMLGYNMYLYCNNNPVNYYDPTGENGEAVAAGWGAAMWWLSMVDGPLPIGDIIYVGGCVIAGVIIVAGATVVADEIDEIIPEPSTNVDDPADSQEEHKKVTGRSLPSEGDPDSDSDLYDEDGLKQTRHYGPDGKAEYDIDYRHQDSHKNHKFPHRHDFDWSKKPPRGEPIDVFHGG